MSVEDADTFLPTSGKKLEQLRATLAGQINGRELGEGLRQEHEQASSAIPGWHRTDGAPELNASEQTKARELVGQQSALRSQVQRMQALIGEVDAMERAGAAVGQLSPKIAEARQIHEQISNALRTVGNYGVPQQAELARMEALAPRLDSIQGLRNGRALYQALPGALDRSVGGHLSALGYQRGAAAPAAGSPSAPAPTGDRVRVRLPDGRVGSIPRSQLAAAQQHGAQVF